MHGGVSRWGGRRRGVLALSATPGAKRGGTDRSGEGAGGLDDGFLTDDAGSEILRLLAARLGLTPANIATIKTRQGPHNHAVTKVSLNSVDATISMLQERLSMEDRELKKVLVSCPMIVGRTRAQLESRLNLLQNRLGLSVDELRRVVVQVPTVLTYSEANVEGKLACLETELGLLHLDREDFAGTLRKMIVRMPKVLSYSEESVVSKLQYLTRRLGLAPNDVRLLATRLPAVLSYSEANLECKLKFLSSRLGLEQEEVRKVVTKLPSVLGYSVEVRHTQPHQVMRVLLLVVVSPSASPFT